MDVYAARKGARLVLLFYHINAVARSVGLNLAALRA